MKRSYDTGQKDNVIFFTGMEVEKTPAYGMKTLFVTGLQEVTQIRDYVKQERCEHIFFGANHSYAPVTSDEFQDWEYMIQTFLDDGIMCSLDIPSTINIEWFLDGGLIEHDSFIPQIRVVVPYIKQWNYNTMVKIDDKGFEESNPGVWCHSLHSFMDHEQFTPWSKYGLDKVLE